MNRIKVFILIVILTFGIKILNAQSNCFEVIQDNSGIPASQFRTDMLEIASCRLIDSLPTIYQDSFKVFDMGFYVHNEVMGGGTPEFFTYAKTTAKQRSKYYLLFGKQSDSNGIYTKFWVDLSLPNSDIFFCIDQLSSTLRNELTQKFEVIANTIHGSNDKSPFQYHIAEEGTIDSLTNYISGLKQCCAGQQKGQVSGCTSCAFSMSQFESLLLNEGLLSSEIDEVIDETNPSMGSEEVGYKIKLGSETIDLDEAISTLKSHLLGKFPTLNIKVYPFNYGQSCSNFEGIKQSFLTENADLGILIGVVGENGEKGTVYWQMISKEPEVPEPIQFTTDTCYIFNSSNLFEREDICAGKGPNGIVENFENQNFNLEFIFSDPAITHLTLTTKAIPDGENNWWGDTEEPEINKFMVMSKTLIRDRLFQSEAFEPKRFTAPFALLTESSGQTANFDYWAKSFFLDRENFLFITDDGDNVVGHNYKNMGNFLWGATTYVMSIPEWFALTGAHLNNLFTEAGWNLDSPDDQYSIKLGRYYAKKMGWKTIYGGRKNIFKK